MLRDFHREMEVRNGIPGRIVRRSSTPLLVPVGFDGRKVWVQETSLR